jgi:hypothetical protein
MRRWIAATVVVGLGLVTGLASARGSHAVGRASEPTFTLINAVCGSGQVQVGRGCWDQQVSYYRQDWSVNDGNASFQGQGTSAAASASYSWTVPQQVSPSGASMSLAVQVTSYSSAGSDNKVCVGSQTQFTIQDSGGNCAEAFAMTSGSSASGSKTVTLQATGAPVNQDCPGGGFGCVTLAIGIQDGGNVFYTYRASAPPPTSTGVAIPTPSTFDQTVTASAPPPGGTAVATSPALMMFGAAQAPVSVDIEGLSVRDIVIANVRHDCYVQFVKAIRGLAAARLVAKHWSTNSEAVFRAYQRGAIVDLASCLAFADAYQQYLYGASAAAASVSCADTPVRLSTVGSGRNARLRSFHFGDNNAPLKVSCARHAGGLTISVSTRSRSIPLSKIVGSRLRIGIARAKSDSPGGQLSVTFHHA